MLCALTTTTVMKACVDIVSCNHATDDHCCAESAKVMATPTGLRQSSRDLGFPPQQQGQEQSQEGMSDLPPGFTYARLESMVRELRTAAALEVLTSTN